MNHRTILAGVLTTGIALTGLAAAATPAQAAGYGVTIKVSDTTPEVDDRVTIKGAVTPAAPGKPVLLQARYDGQQAWKTVGRSRLNQAGKYQFREKVETVRERQYRVVKPANGRFARAISSKEKVTVFAWRDLTSLTAATSNGMYEDGVTMNGVAYPGSVVEGTFFTAPTRTIDYNLGRDCTELTGTAGLSDSSLAAGTSTLTIATDGTQRFSQAFALTQTAPVSIDLTGVFRLTVSGTAANGGLGALGSPQVYCSF